MSSGVERLPTVVITGSQGFVGNSLTSYMLQKGFYVRCLCRKVPVDESISHNNVSYYEVDDICNMDSLVEAFKGADVVVHLAARAHIMNPQRSDEISEYDRINHLGTIAVSKAAKIAEVKRVVFVSSIKVNGEKTVLTPFTPFDTPQPSDPYGDSKLAAEIALKEILSESSTQWVIVRPPLIYGPGVKGNLARLEKLVVLGIPLPFLTVSNKRSLVGVQNFCDFIVTCALHAAAPGQTFLVADSRQGMSTPALIKEMSRVLGKRVLLFPVPVSLLYAVARILRKEALIDRLCGNLDLDISDACDRLEWIPPFTVSEQMALAFPSSNSRNSGSQATKKGTAR